MAIKSLLAGLWLTGLWLTGPAWADQAPLPPAALAFAQQAQAELERMDLALAKAACELAPHDLTSPEARTVLRALLMACPLAIDVCTVDLQGRMVTIEPKGYHHLEGSDISGQEQVKRLWQSKRPVMSKVFLTLEGVAAADLEHPVLAGDGGLRGSVSLLFRPETTLTATLRKFYLGRDMEPWAMDSAGRILFNQDPHEVDRLLFMDDMYQDYPEVVAVGRRMMAEPRGEGVYSLPPRGMRQAVSKHCAWATVELHGAWWRLVVARPDR
jgi:hypothetical protein